MNTTPDPRLEELDRLAHNLDARFRLPGTDVRFGLESIIGIVPGVGDAVSLLPAGYILMRGYRMGARRRTLLRMAANTGIDTLLGAIPFLGDAFDVLFKANLRNIDLLRRDITRQGAAT